MNENRRMVVEYTTGKTEEYPTDIYHCVFTNGWVQFFKHHESGFPIVATPQTVILRVRLATS